MMIVRRAAASAALLTAVFAALLAPAAACGQAPSTLPAAKSPAAQANAAKAPGAKALRARVDSLARAFVASAGAPGVSVQVVRGHDTIVSAGYGMADLENRVPATAATVYRIGSVTKQFTAAGVMRLVEQGKVALDDSIAAYVPGLPAAWRRVTVRQLLNHTSGIPSYTDLGPTWVRRWGEAMSPDTLVALTAGDTMWFAPGTRWRYDNTGYVVLGMLLDRVTGKPYPEWIEEQLARPLGLQHTYYCDERRVIPARAHGYERVPEGWRNATYLNMTQPYSAGALCSTVGDLARWNTLLASGGVVRPASYATMSTPEGAAAKAERRYGYGLMRDTLAGHLVITHGGGIHGFISDNAWFPDDSLSVTVLTNSGSARATPLLRNIARAALGVPLDRPMARVPLSADQRNLYAGRYDLVQPDGVVMPFRIVAGASALMASGGEQPPVELIPLGAHVFGVEFDPALRFTFTVEGGKATSFTLQQGGARMAAKRVGDAP